MPIRGIIIMLVGVLAAATFCRDEIYCWLKKYVLKDKENDDE